jgi:hypothetical protein
MKRIFAVLLISLLFATFAKAQSLNELKRQYNGHSPLSYPDIKSRQLVDADTSDKTPAEEQLAEMKTEELEEKKAQEEKIYLDTDYQFFQSLNITLDEDELDKAYKAKQLAENIEKLKNTDTTVKTEITATAPNLMTPKEGQAVDDKRTFILKKITTNGQYVRACILQHKKGLDFKGTAMTLAWEIEPSGKVVNTEIKATDVENKEIQTCVLNSLAEWNFSDAMKAQTKNSHIEYTYRLVNANKEAVAAKPTTPTATVPN